MNIQIKIIFPRKNFIVLLKFLKDCHGSLKGNTVVQDDTQNYIVIDGYQNSTHTQIQFRRALETCDPHDTHLGVSIYLIDLIYNETKRIFNKLYFF